MRPFIYCVLLSLVVLVGIAAAPLSAQTVDFEAELLESDAQDLRGRVERMDNRLRIAENAVQIYVNDSVDDMIQGHREGFAQFRVWYRDYESRRSERMKREQLLAHIVSQGLMKSVDHIFPGAGKVTGMFKKYAEKAYTKALTGGIKSEGDVATFLDKHQAVLEQVLSDLETLDGKFSAEHADILDLARWEQVLSGGETNRLVPETVRLLADVGVPEPGQATIATYRDRVLERQIRAVLAAYNTAEVRYSDWELDIIARVLALKHLTNDPDRYCPVERRLRSWWQTPTCRKWSSPSRRAR